VLIHKGGPMGRRSFPRDGRPLGLSTTVLGRAVRWSASRGAADRTAHLEDFWNQLLRLQMLLPPPAGRARTLGVSMGSAACRRRSLRSGPGPFRQNSGREPAADTPKSEEFRHRISNPPFSTPLITASHRYYPRLPAISVDPNPAILQ